MATNLDVLQVERDFIESQVDDATARVRYIQALTQLYAAEGTLLERRGISMEAVNEHKETLGTPTYE
jgi:outer membrane protein TolC